jgi:hypothetical protein
MVGLVRVRVRVFFGATLVEDEELEETIDEELPASEEVTDDVPALLLVACKEE